MLDADAVDAARRRGEALGVLAMQKAYQVARNALGHAPRIVQRAMTGLVSSPRMFNLVVSNIPGPRVPLYLRPVKPSAPRPISTEQPSTRGFDGRNEPDASLACIDAASGKVITDIETKTLDVLMTRHGIAEAAS